MSQLSAGARLDGANVHLVALTVTNAPVHARKRHVKPLYRGRSGPPMLEE